MTIIVVTQQHYIMITILARSSYIMLGYIGLDQFLTYKNSKFLFNLSYLHLNAT